MVDGWKMSRRVCLAQGDVVLKQANDFRDRGVVIKGTSVSQPEIVTPRPSAAVVLARDGTDDGDGAGAGITVFLVRRHVRSEFAPDVFVFPGGSVAPEDREAERSPGLCAPLADENHDERTALGQGFRAAALRECFEEADVLLARRGETPLSLSGDDAARFAAYRDAVTDRSSTLAAIAQQEDLTLATDELLHWAHWITPEMFPRRFDTHFFFAAMPPGQQAAHDQLETTESVWITPEEALRRFAQGSLPLVFATEHQLRALSSLPDIAAARLRFGARPPETIMPRVAQQDGQEVIVISR